LLARNDSSLDFGASNSEPLLRGVRFVYYN